MKKILILPCLIASISLADNVTIGYPANGEIPLANETKTIDTNELFKLIGNVQKGLDGANKIQEALGQGGSGFVGNVSGNTLGSIGNVNSGLFDTIDNYYNIFDKGSEQAFNILMGVGDAATQALNIAAAAPMVMGTGVGHYATIGANIQMVMQRLQAARKRIDDLKQYKRWLDSIKGLTEGDFKTIVGIKDTLGKIENIVKDGIALTKEDLARDYAKDIDKTDMSKAIGWDNKNTKDIIELKDTNKTLTQVATTKTVLDTIQNQQKQLSNVNATTTLQQLKQMSAQTDLLITLLTKLIADQSRQIGDEALKNQRALQEEIAQNKLHKTNAINLENYQNELKTKVQNSNHKSGVSIFLK